MSKRTDDTDQIQFIIEKQIGEIDSGQVYELQNKRDGKSDHRVIENEQQQRGGGTERLQNVNQGSLDYKVNLNVQHQDLSWLRVKNLVPQKEMLKPPSKKKKVQWSDFETKLVNSRSTAQGFLQNRQMGKASKKDWDTDIVYIRNIFAYWTVWLNPIRIESKLGRYTHPFAAGWLLYMWETMMLRALTELIKQEDISSKLKWQIKENTALNKAHEFLAGANIDRSLQNLISLNYNFYRFMYSNCVNIIYMNKKEYLESI